MKENIMQNKENEVRKSVIDELNALHVELLHLMICLIYHLKQKIMLTVSKNKIRPFFGET